MPNYSNKKVLVIEDFVDFANAVKAMLEQMGVTDCMLSTSGEAAIQLCRENNFDIILSDYNLGEKKDGQQVLEELVSLKLMPVHCTFIMITAEKTVAMVMAALEFQPDGYLTKPFNGSLLKSRLDKAIDKKEMLAPINILMSDKKWLPAYNKSSVVAKQYPKLKTDCARLKFECLKQAKKTKQALELVEELSKDRDTPWSLKSKGCIYFMQNELLEAEKLFSKMVMEFPMALEGYDWLAKIQRQLGRPLEAQATLQIAVKKSPKLIKRQRSLGQVAEHNKDFDTMASAYRQAVHYGKHSIFSEPEEYVKLTKSIGNKLKIDANNNRQKLVDEAKNTFKKIRTRFKDDYGVQFRGAVAHADFSCVIDDNESQRIQLENANKIFEQLEEHLTAKDSLETAESLKTLELPQLAESVLELAVEQYLDNPVFMEKAAKLTSNKQLIKNALHANLLNNQAIKIFADTKLDSAIELLTEAAQIAPNNVNICLNSVQVLLKRSQLESIHNEVNQANSKQSTAQRIKDLHQSEQILSSINGLPSKDPKHARYTELDRLNRLMLQKM
ncbi:MAG: response regulator [Kangiellaceae bacterium]|nr:response regulator [Kangiellaceae bacterium]